jgi:hypothetical protein
MTNAAKWISIVVALYVAQSGLATAQTLKKYITRDGKTVYSDRPVPGAKEVGEIKAPPKLDPSSRSQAQSAAQKEAQAVKALDKRLEDSAAQRARVEAAEAKLEEAKRTLAGGKEPLPSERIGTAGGQSRLNDDYWARQ